MKKIAVVYWSGTGNTEAMANAVADGAREAGAEVSLLSPADFDASAVSAYEGIAFGCPAMGAEVLEESEYQPMWDACKGNLGGKAVALFGSYGWGDGGWMRSWEEECEDLGVNRVCESVICNDAPDDEGIAACKALGLTLAQ